MVKLPVCFESKSTATVFRSLLDELKYKYKRTNVNRSYTSIAIVIAMEKTALVYRYEIHDIAVVIDIWEEKPGSGKVTYIEMRGDENEKISNLLKQFSEKLPRKPWEYTFTQRIRNGWFSQGIFRAKAKWKNYVK